MDDFSTEANGKGYIYSSRIPEDKDLDFNFVSKHCFGSQDGQPDIFYYNVLGYSGKFFLERKTDPSSPVKVILLSNKEKIKIDYDEAKGEWTVITKEGYKFILGTKEYTQTVQFPLSGYQLPYPDYHFSQIDPLDPKNWKTISSWHVDKIISPLNEHVLFEYKGKPAEDKEIFLSRSVLSVSETRTDIRGIGGHWSIDAKYSGFLDALAKIISFGVGDVLLNEVPPAPSCGNGRTFSGSFTLTYNVYLKSISFSNGTINFHTSERQDISEYYDFSGPQGQKRFYSKPHKLDKIEIIGAQSGKTIQFDYDYFNNSSSMDAFLYKRLKLNRVTEVNGVEKKKPYVFSYQGDASNGSNFSLPAKNSPARDHWGFYNRKESNKTAGIAGVPTLIPAIEFAKVEVAIVISDDKTQQIVTEIPNGEIQRIPGADRNTDEQASLLGTLIKVQYPTGGHTLFQYESNTFNLEEGTREPKDFFYSTVDRNEFEVPAPALVTISSELKVSTRPNTSVRVNL